MTNLTVRPDDIPVDARLLGYRLPAEWEPHECVWVTLPHNALTWPGCLELAQRQFENLIRVMQPYVRVRTTQSLGIATDDSWIRDYGPLFVINQNGGLASHDFVFNCWGKKYEPYDLDDAVPARIAAQLGIRLWAHSMVLEGGSIDVNGQGTIMTTEQCLLDANRNPMLSRDQIEQELHRAFGTRHVIWLAGGIEGDDTDGHIDDVARFINPSTVAAVRARPNHPDYEILERNWRLLQQARDQHGNRLNLVPLPVPQPIYYDYPPEDGQPGGRRPLPASYANFLISNNAAFVPIFGQSGDEQALRAIERAMPGYRVIGVRAEHLVVGLGGVHCLTMQQPQARKSIE